MGVDRPTFSEHWPAVAQLRPRLRATVQIERVQQRNRRWRVLCDAASQRFFRMNEGAYRFVGLLDGRRTVDEAWRLAQRAGGDEAPTQGEAVELLGQLWSNDLLQADVPPPAQAALRLQRLRWRKQAAGLTWRFLFIKAPLVDPDAFLERWVAATRWMFSPVGGAVWLLVVLAGIGHLLGRWDAFFAQSQGALSPSNLPLLYAAFVGVKLAHELAHGFACKALAQRQGLRAEVRTLGVMLLALLPFPYVDASASWLLRRRRDRALVAAAGVLAELFIAAVALIVWARSAPGAVHALAHNVVLIASVSTLLFNGNPLLRYDAYYLLSDWLDAPNLADRARQQLARLVRRYCFGLRRALPVAASGAEATALAVYGVLAFVYRLFLAGAIALYLLGLAPALGALLAAAAVGGLVVAPAARGVWWLLASPELTGRRSRAVLTTAALAMAVVAPLALAPAPRRVVAPATAQPARRAAVYASAAGFVERVAADGSRVEQGRTLVQLRDPAAQSELAQLQHEERALLAQLRRAQVEQPALAQALAARLESHRRRLEQLRREIAARTLRAPFDGVWIAPRAAQSTGRHVARGELLGELVDLSSVAFRAALSQGQAEALALADERVRVRLWGGAVADGLVVRAAPAALPDEALTQRRDGMGRDAVFHLDVALAPEETLPVLVGERATVELALPPQPLLRQGLAWLRRLLLWRLGR